MITCEEVVLVLIIHRYGVLAVCNPDVDHMAFFRTAFNSSLCHNILSLSVALALVNHIIYYRPTKRYHPHRVTPQHEYSKDVYSTPLSFPVRVPETRCTQSKPNYIPLPASFQYFSGLLPVPLNLSTTNNKSH